MKVYLVRHGETAGNQARQMQGSVDTPLNDRGKEQAAMTAEALMDVSFDRAFCSPLSRTRETAAIILGERTTPLEQDPRLMEIAFGEAEGRSITTAKTDPEDPMYPFFCEPEKFVPMQGGETYEDVRLRTAEFLAERVLPLEGTCEAVLVVSHGVAIRSIVNPVAALPLKDFWLLPIKNCTVTVLSVENGQLRIEEEPNVYYE